MRFQSLKSRLGLAVGIGAVIVAGDLVTKRIAAISFADERLTVIPDVLWFNFVENPGAAFSLFQNAGPYLGAAAIVAVVFILASLRHPRPTIEVVSFGLIAGGAVGNLVDRIARGDAILDGKVIDWIQVPNFPLFNIADSAVTVGVVLLFIAAWRGEDVEAAAPTSTVRQ